MKHLLFALLATTALAFCNLPTQTQAREFTNTAGTTIQAELIEVKGSGADQRAVLKLASGKTAEVAVSNFSEADRNYIAEQATNLADSDSSASSSSSAGPSLFKEPLDGKLVAVEGKRVSKHEMDSDPDMYAFYFSAHWCPPCRTFTPKLVEFYNAHAEQAGTDFELIFVSSDHDEDSIEDYMTGDQMPWPAIKFRYAKPIDEVSQYARSGIPCLVLVDREGNVLSHSYEGDNYVGPSKVMGDLKKRLAE